MTPDERADKLAAIAMQLAARVREDAPESVHQWLAAEMAGEDWLALAVVLAAAVPDRPWSRLVSWTRLRPQRNDTHGTAGAVARHGRRHEQLCDECRIYERDRKRDRRAQGSAQAVDDVGMVA